MFKIIARPEGTLVDIEVRDRLSAEDFASLKREMSPLIEEYGKARLLFDLSSLERFEWDGLWDEQAFEDHDSVERVALVVPDSQRAQAERVFSLGADQLRSFDPAERQRASDWLAA